MIGYSRFAAGAATFALSVFATSCTQQSADTRAVNEAAIRDADVTWSKAAAAKQVDKIVSYYTDKASSFVDGGPTAAGKDAIRGQWEELFMMGYSINWQPTNVEVAQSGDLGYSQGTYEEKTTQGSSNQGKYVVIWKKQADGAWTDI
jgi:ketosteroid isomerase-like protein